MLYASDSVHLESSHGFLKAAALHDVSVTEILNVLQLMRCAYACARVLNSPHCRMAVVHPDVIAVPIPTALEMMRFVNDSASRVNDLSYPKAVERPDASAEKSLNALGMMPCVHAFARPMKCRLCRRGVDPLAVNAILTVRSAIVS